MMMLLFLSRMIIIRSARATTDLGAPTWWPRYTGSHVAVLLDGEWAYGFTESLDSVAASWDAVATVNTSMVPGTVDAAPPGFYGKRGASYYARNISTSSNATYFLELMGCAFYCKAWVDGVEVGTNRAGGYAPFRVPVPPGARSLTILADNRFNTTTAPLHTGGDFWHYGGLVRSVVLHAVDPTVPTVVRARIFPEFDGTAWYVNASVELSANATAVDVDLSWDDGARATTIAGAPVSRGNVVELRGLRVPNPRVWGLRAPRFHTLGVSANGGGVVERFGLRTWSVVESEDGASRLALNGEPVKLLGYNHHTQWPDTGMSPTDTQLDEDVGLLARVGATYVRGAHYPQDQRWLDRLDELGIVVWEEALGPGVDTANTLDPDFMTQQLLQLDQMVSASANHPSVFTWGFWNEGPSDDPAACDGYQTCADKLHALDATRFVTWASNKQNDDVCLDAATLVSFNSYPGWYEDVGNLDSPYALWTYQAEWVKANYPTRPFVISETGAGGIYEWNDNQTDVYWSLKYQSEIVSADVRVVLGNPQFSGLTLWHFFDFKGNDDAQENGPCDYVPDLYPPICAYVNVTDDRRPGGLNHKGSIDYWRRPKPIFYQVADLYRSFL